MTVKEIDISVKVVEKGTFSEEIMTIADEQVGKGFLQLEDLASNKRVIQAAFIKGELVGFSFIDSVQQQELFELDSKIKMACRSLTCVKRGWEGVGIGRALVAEGIYYCSKKFDFLYCEAWESEKGVHIKKLLLENRYEFHKKIEGYWAEESLDKNYICPNCGNPPCTCTAHIYKIEF